MCKEKTPGELLAEELFYRTKNAGEELDAAELARADAFCEEYKTFLDHAKIEREAVRTTVAMLEKAGYTAFDPDRSYQPGDRIYRNVRGKALILATIGTEDLEKGVRMVISHIDSPRLDLKPNPLYEDGGLALFKTHYYGGVKKYQWTALPLALHGTVVRKDGTVLDVVIGEDAGDPVFCVTDLLPHLAKDQMTKTLSEGIKGEQLNVVVGSRPYPDEKVKEKIKLNILSLLHEKYGLVEGDFLSAELTMVPAGAARDVGFDRSMIGSYGHDDKVCAYTSLRAAMDVAAPAFTSVTVFADKEEIGSDGNTGLNSDFLKIFVEDLCAAHGAESRRTLTNSTCMSADVNAAFDPTFPEVAEKRNTAYLNHGVVITKYTGARGKSGTNDASAEFMHYVRDLLDRTGVIWQTGELGAVDQGGGGTVAMFVAHMNVEVVDVGVPVLSMHAPFELVSKTDVYMTYRAFVEFLKA